MWVATFLYLTPCHLCDGSVPSGSTHYQLLNMFVVCFATRTRRLVVVVRTRLSTQLSLFVKRQLHEGNFLSLEGVTVTRRAALR